MHVFYEDSGQFKAEKVLSRATSTLQVEAASGRRSKIRAANVLFEFDAPTPAELMTQAQAQQEAFDIPFLWECAPQEDIEVATFAEDYFGETPTPVQKAALVMALHSAPAYFHRRGKGRYRPAPPDILEAALAAIKKKEAQAQQQEAWTTQMIEGRLPPELAEVAPGFLTRPDKNSLEWKAFEAAGRACNLNHEALLLKLGVWPHALALHQSRFLAAWFPRGTGFPDYQFKPDSHDLPQADVTAYSLDDSNTTEIDDALSITPLDGDRVRVGVHIAVPALAIERDSDLDRIARQRMATVYVPGDKIPMLPYAVIEHFSLLAGTWRPALSLYIEMALSSGEVLDQETRLESLCVRQNLHHTDFDPDLDAATLDDATQPVAHEAWLRPLWQVSRHLAHQRDLTRGKPETHDRVDFMFALDGSPDDPNAVVELIPRKRNAPLDLLVAEFMILANNAWGGLLDERGLPGIYRSSQAGRVRMTTHALPHDTIGVPQYVWSTSPLRRYVDLVNQQQIIAAAQHGVSARLVAPFKPRDAELFGIISSFDTQYAAWRDHQNTLERYWTLRWIQQHELKTVRAVVIRDKLFRLLDAPLVTRIGQAPELPRGQQVTLDILAVNELTLELECRLASDDVDQSSSAPAPCTPS
ncbi:MAG TPA: ribonuclease catalytic domain-containing protein [Burkholderiaceae bacterium]|nr:ribonuclease catalytic domain-containing protein [Burkholderiaceae bacterium]